MTYLNRTYSCKARFYADSDVESDKIWYWCEPGAAEFSDYSLHGAQVFMDRQVPLANWKYPGEVPRTLQINKGANPHNSPGVKGCQIGDTHWFVSGIPSGKTIIDVVIPPCCRPPLVPPAQWINWAFVGPSGTYLWEVEVPPLTNYAILNLYFPPPGGISATLPVDWSVVFDEYMPGTAIRHVMLERFVDPGFLAVLLDPGDFYPTTATLDYWANVQTGVVARSEGHVASADTVAAPSLDVTGTRSAALHLLLVPTDRTFLQLPTGDFFQDAGIAYGSPFYIAWTNRQWPLAAGPTGDQTWSVDVAAAMQARQVIVS